MTDAQRKDEGNKPKNPWHGDPKLALPKILLALGFVSIVATFIAAGTSYFSAAPPPPSFNPAPPPPGSINPAPPPAAPDISPATPTAPTPLLLLPTLFVAGIAAAIAGGVLYIKRKKRSHKKTIT